jgi:Outer membrane lipoprotein-sorting protein
MLGRRRFVRVLIVLIAASWPALADEPKTPRELLKEAIEAYPETPFTAKTKLSWDGVVREMTLSHRRLDDQTSGSYLVVTAPQAVKGTRFLFLERKQGKDEQYIKVPATHRVLQVGEKQREQSFLGSDFYFSDMIAPDLDGFELTELSRETVAGRECRIIEAVPKPSTEWQYGKARYAVQPDDRLVLRAEFFDKKGKLFKVWTLDKVEKVNGIWTPYVQRMKNVQQKMESVLELVEIQYGVTLPDEMFTSSYLER